jgi:hypothetical protein
MTRCSFLSADFTQTDPAPYGAGHSFESAYVYGGGRPTVMTDPNGMRFGLGVPAASNPIYEFDFSLVSMKSGGSSKPPSTKPPAQMKASKSKKGQVKYQITVPIQQYSLAIELAVGYEYALNFENMNLPLVMVVQTDGDLLNFQRGQTRNSSSLTFDLPFLGQQQRIWVNTPNSVADKFQLVIDARELFGGPDGVPADNAPTSYIPWFLLQIVAYYRV